MFDGTLEIGSSDPEFQRLMLPFFYDDIFHSEFSKNSEIFWNFPNNQKFNKNILDPKPGSKNVRSGPGKNTADNDIEYMHDADIGREWGTWSYD